MADDKKTVILDFQADTRSAVKSVDELTKANERLRDERDKVDTSTKQGKDQAKALDDQISKNTQTINSNTAALDKQAKGTKAFGESMDTATGGVYGMIKASLAFIATPIGLIITALGAALYAVTSYFKSSEDAQNKWNKIIVIGKTLLEALMNVVEGLGEVLVGLFEHPKESLESLGKMITENLFNRFTGILNLIPRLADAIGLLFEGKFAEAAKTAGDAVLQVVTGVEHATDKMIAFVAGVAEATNAAILMGERLAAIQAKLDKDERDLILARSKTNLEVARLRREAVTQEGDEKRATIMEAIALEEALASKELANRQLILEQKQLELKANGDDKDALLAVAEAEAAVIDAKALNFEATLRFSKEIEKLDDAKRAKDAKAAEDQKKIRDKNLKDQADSYTKFLEDAAKQREENAAKQTALDKKAADTKKLLDGTIAQNENDLLNSVLGTKKVNYAAGFALFKKGAIAQLVTTQAEMAAASFASAAEIPVIGWLLAPIAYAAAWLQGAAAITSAAGVDVGFQKGGYTGDGPVNQVAGSVHGQEYVIDAPTTAAYGKDFFDQFTAGSMIANASTGSQQSQMPAVEVNLGYKEFNEFGNKVRFKESITTA